jgi:hypothetical protein
MNPPTLSGARERLSGTYKEHAYFDARGDTLADWGSKLPLLDHFQDEFFVLFSRAFHNQRGFYPTLCVDDEINKDP